MVTGETIDHTDETNAEVLRRSRADGSVELDQGTFRPYPPGRLRGDPSLSRARQGHIDMLQRLQCATGAMSQHVLASARATCIQPASVWKTQQRVFPDYRRRP